MEDERRRVLNLLDAGRITTEQALALLDALQPPGRPQARAGDHPRPAARITRVLAPPRTTSSGGSGGGSRWLRLRVMDGGGRSKVDLQLPLGLLGLFLRVGSRWLPQLRSFDPDLLLALMQWRGNGKLFEVVDDEGGDRVEISIE